MLGEVGTAGIGVERKAIGIKRRDPAGATGNCFLSGAHPRNRGKAIGIMIKAVGARTSWGRGELLFEGHT